VEPITQMRSPEEWAESVLSEMAALQGLLSAEDRLTAIIRDCLDGTADGELSEEMLESAAGGLPPRGRPPK